MLWRQCPSTYEWINKTWYIHTIEYYAPIKKKSEVLLHATIWMNFENVLSRRSQTRKSHIVHMNPFI